MSAVLHRIRCAGCRQTVAFSASPTTLRHKVYCDEYCAAQAPATENNERNIEWTALADAGVSPVKIGQMYGSAHSVVYKTLARLRKAA
jgi:hypothetical protein